MRLQNIVLPSGCCATPGQDDGKVAARLSLQGARIRDDMCERQLVAIGDTAARRYDRRCRVLDAGARDLHGARDEQRARRLVACR